jgi:site-specific recombinase XerD
MKAGRRPFGYFPDELSVVEQLFLKANRRPHGKEPTYQAITDSLNRDGHKTQKGLPWYPIAVRRIMCKGLDYYRTLHDMTEPEPEEPEKKKYKPKTQLDSNDYLTKEEIVQCRAVLRDTDRMLFEVLLGAGLRAFECCALEVRDIGIYAGKSMINIRHGKGYKRRSVHIGPRLKSLLTGFLQAAKDEQADGETPLFKNKRGKQLTYSNLYDRIVKIRKRSGVTCLHPHALRHTFGTHLYSIKTDLKYVRDQLGHASIATTEIYAKTLTKSKLDQMVSFEKSLEL